MTATTMTPAQLTTVRGEAAGGAADAEERLAEFDDAMAEVRTARSDATADDEHDPEGPTMTQEWSQRTAVLADVRAELAEIDRALARIADGSYGICARCGKRITVASPRRAPHRDALHRLRAPRGLSRRLPARRASRPGIVSASGPDASSAAPTRPPPPRASGPR